MSCMAALKTINHRISTTPGRSMLGVHRPGRHYIRQGEANTQMTPPEVKLLIAGDIPGVGWVIAETTPRNTKKTLQRT